MKNLFAMLVVFFGLAFAPVAHCQWSHQNESCNQAYAKTGVPQESLTIIVKMLPHYTATGTQAEIQSVQTALILDLNDQIQKQFPNNKLVFTETSETNTQYNIAVNADVYNDNGTYSTYLEVRGLGVGHLFRENPVSNTNVGDSVVDAIENLPTFFVNGWTCNN